MKDAADEIDKTISDNQNIGSITVNKVKKAHSAYVEKDRKTFYQDLLELNGTANAAETAAAAAGAVENLEKAQAGLSQYQAGLETLKQKLAAAANDEEKAQIEAQIAAVNAKITELETTISALQAGIQQQGVDRLENGFQAKSGMTFQDAVKKARMKKARTMLKETNQTVESIAAYVGYENVEHFNRLFKKAYEMTPVQFRRKYQ